MRAVALDLTVDSCHFIFLFFAVTRCHHLNTDIFSVGHRRKTCSEGLMEVVVGGAKSSERLSHCYYEIKLIKEQIYIHQHQFSNVIKCAPHYSM